MDSLTGEFSFGESLGVGFNGAFETIFFYSCQLFLLISQKQFQANVGCVFLVCLVHPIFIAGFVFWLLSGISCKTSFGGIPWLVEWVRHWFCSPGID